MDLDDKLCYCFHVSKRKVVNFVKQTRPGRPSQVSQCFGAGTGCGWCIPFLVKIHAQVMRGDAVKADDISPEEYEAMRAQYRQAVEGGGRARNSFEGLPDAAPEAVEPAGPAPLASEAPSAPVAEPEAFDYTRYFSRSRPDPEPETLKDAAPRRKKGT